MATQNDKKKVHDFINKTIGVFELDGDLDLHYKGRDILDYKTRENGNVGDETYGEEDYKSGLLLEKKVKEKFGSLIEETRLSCVDEWVHVAVFLRKED